MNLNRPIFLFLSAVPLLFLSACARNAPAAAKKDTGPVQVNVARVSVRSIQRSVEGIGTLFPFDEAIISAETDGPLQQVSADLGDLVAQGQVLARISDEEARYLVSQQEAQLRQSLERLGLKDDKDRLQDVREAPDVRRAKADLFEVEIRYKRTRELVDQGIGPKSDLDQAQARFQSAQAAYDQTLNQTRNLVQEIERYKASLDLQRKKLRDTTVRAPFAAFVKDRQAVVGAYVRANSPLFTLVKIDPIRLRVEVPERMAPWVKLGQRAEVIVEAFEGRKFEGRVSRISPTVDQTKRTFVVEALIQNSKNELKPGSYARARLDTDKMENIRVVPPQAILYVLGTNKSYVVKKDASIDVRDVKVGDRFPKEIEILEGLNEGETVAISSLTRLDMGSKVKISAAEAN
ncbi:efflux RND transporter periplasmic adaptor subunit [Paludibaculum fermentans]|uniref:Efflux RND transporter periplasmic adaptor subunit n=1 Tax=Paludibaculum fermentans TaxID=1473598 RepID=A0A7S7SKF8_PALFE|nr:efflux RND transporter periplasmic adaptor subunit [Paludibaculum fermentans]QOY89107.1 efflux RND transporter periplasmic adaptor subunit [Paludibaculum fermentans]